MKPDRLFLLGIHLYLGTVDQQLSTPVHTECQAVLFYNYSWVCINGWCVVSSPENKEKIKVMFPSEHGRVTTLEKSRSIVGP